jgi:hypothetical protein
LELHFWWQLSQISNEMPFLSVQYFIFEEPFVDLDGNIWIRNNCDLSFN